MNIQKPLAIVAATIISVAGMYGIANHSYAPVVSSTQQPAAATTLGAIRTLPTINVYPTAAQLQELQQDATAPVGSAG